VVRFIHTSDWQLGMGRAFLGPEALPRFQQARIDVIAGIGRAAQDHGAQFVVVAGDVFDDNAVTPQTIARTCAVLAEVPVPVYLLPGNHDPLDGGSVYDGRRFLDAVPSNVVVVRDTTPLVVPDVPAEIVGVPWRSKRPGHDLNNAALAAAPAVGDGRVRILLGHGQADEGVAPDPDAPTLVRGAPLLTARDAGRVHYVALGDRHSTLDAGGHGLVWFSGAPEVTAFRDPDAGNVLVVEVTPDRPPHVTSVRVGRWRFDRLEVELRDEASVDALDARLAAIDEPATTVVRLVARGVVSLATHARFTAVLDRHRPGLAVLDFPARHAHLTIEPQDADVDALDLQGYARETVDELRDLAATDEVAAEALVQLFRIETEARR
jgi:DNA repair exonuclease SbcCD nuclease subunit